MVSAIYCKSATWQPSPSLPVSPLGTFLASPLDPMDRHGRGLARDIGVLRTMLLHCQLKLCGFVQQDGKWQAGAAFGRF